MIKQWKMMWFYEIWGQLWLILESFLAPILATRWRDLHLKKKNITFSLNRSSNHILSLFGNVLLRDICPKALQSLLSHTDTMSELAKCGAGKQKHVWCVVARRSWLHWCVIIYSVRTQHRRRETCLIKRIPLKCVMECWVWNCGQWTWGDMCAASGMFDHHRGRRHTARNIEERTPLM